MICANNLYPEKLDLTDNKTISAKNRNNLVTLDKIRNPKKDTTTSWNHIDLPEIAERIIEARKNSRQVIWSMGGHVIKCGLSDYIIDLLEKNIITHVAGNGSVSIHDFELAYLGGTSEDVPSAIEDGTFGMWEETGLWMNQAIQQGFKKNLGFGASIANYIDNNPDRFPYKKFSVVYQSYKMGVPATFHISIGTDIIQQHPSVNFAALGGASGIDFKIFCKSVSQLEGGVFLNFGSAVTGPEIFLKALSIARNQNFIVKNIITANFDIIPLGDNYREEISKNNFHYFYRPRKNIINRPTTLGGKGYYIKGNHKDTIPKLHEKILDKLEKS